MTAPPVKWVQAGSSPPAGKLLHQLLDMERHIHRLLITIHEDGRGYHTMPIHGV